MGRDWQIWWAWPLADRLLQLHHSGAAEIRWCSTWNSDAREIERLLGLPPLQAAFCTTGIHPRGIALLKRQAALNVLDQESRPLIWVDDNEVPFNWELSYAAMAQGDRALLIRPKEALGLVPEHLDRIEEFCQRFAAGVLQ
jgi:hypothetical protein